MSVDYDLIIVGAGPAGLAAAIYAGRANLKILIIEKKGEGSLISAHKIDNYPGFVNGIAGKDLQEKMKEHALRFDTKFEEGTLLELEEGSEVQTVKTDKKTYTSYSVIVATGFNKKIGKKLTGEEEFSGKGVSYCAACDGAFFQGMNVAVFGNGEEACEEALILTQNAEKVYFFVNGKRLEAEKSVISMVQTNQKIEIVYNTLLEELKGKQFLDEVLVKNIESDELKSYKVEGAFLYLGTKSSFDLFSTFAKLDESGAIITDEKMQTLADGIFAAGDVRYKKVRQITTAVADGTVAGLEAIKYVMKQKNNNN